MTTYQRYGANELTGIKTEKMIEQAGPGYLDEIAGYGRTLGRHEISASIPHNELFMTLGYVKGMMEDTRSSFRMVTGSDYIAQELSDSFREMCDRLARMERKAHIIVIDGKGSSFRKEEELFPKSLRVTHATSRKQDVQHFMVSDGRRLREEELHRPLSTIAPSNLIHAEFHPNRPAIATLMETRFASMWAALNNGENIDAKPKQKQLEKKRWYTPWRNS